jgi:hypothetical protein
MIVRLHVGDFEVAYRGRRNLSDAVRIGINYVAIFPGGPSRSHGCFARRIQWLWWLIHHEDAETVFG